MSDFFKNTFGKDDSQHNLQYDNTAFVFFIMSVSSLLSVILFILILRHIKTGGRSRRQYNLVAKDKLFQEKTKALSGRIPSVYTSFSFLFKVGLLVVFVAVSALAFQQAEGQNTTLKGFDPYELLGVDSDTPVSQIKKAYRKLALELHPDRNPNNPEAASKFIFVSKAYECLTDETKREKCLKSGNPDGSESINVGIALPSFLVAPSNQIYVLFAIFALLLLVIPKIFLMWNNKVQTKDGRGVSVQNYYLLYKMFIDMLSPDGVMKAASLMKEVENLNDQPGYKVNEEYKKQLEERIEQERQEQEAFFNHGRSNQEDAHDHGHQNCDHDHSHDRKPQDNQNAHDHQGGCCDEDFEDVEEEPDFTDDEYSRWKRSLKPVPSTSSSTRNLLVIGGYIRRQVMYHKLLEEMPNLLRSMIYFSLDFCTKSSKKKKSLFQDDPNLFFPYMGTPAYHVLLSISKNFYQNTEGSPQGLQNLTLTKQQVQTLTKEFTIRQLTVNEATKNKFLQKFKDAEKKESLKQQIELMPAFKMEVSTFAGDQEETTFCERDTVTFKFKITKNPTHGVAFLPNYGYLKREKFYFTLEVKQELLYFQEVVFEPGQTQYTIQYSSYRSRDICDQSFLALVRSDCYFGLDVGKNIPLKFVQFSGDEKIIYNKEDLHIERAPKGYFEAALSIELNDPLDNILSDTDDNADQQEIPAPTTQQHAQRAPAMQKMQ